MQLKNKAKISNDLQLKKKIKENGEGYWILNAEDLWILFDLIQIIQIMEKNKGRLENIDEDREDLINILILGYISIFSCFTLSLSLS